MLNSTSDASLAFAGNQTIFLAGDRAGLWRVVEGAVRLDRASGPNRQPVQLALPGDLIGTEALCGRPYQFSASAFTHCRLQALPAESEAARAALLQQALLQNLGRSQDMTLLRTGSVLQRLSHLLSLLGLEHAARKAGLDGRADAVRQALPTLREMALLIDAKTETVCRALAQLLPPRSRKSGPARSTPLDWAPAVAARPVSGRAVPGWAANSGPVGVAA